MIRIAALALIATGCGASLGSKDVTVTDTTRVTAAATFASLGASGVGAAFTREGVDPAHIAKARLLSFSLTCTTAGKDLSFFQTGKLSIQTSAADKTEIANATSFPAGQPKVDFAVVPDVDLKPFVTAATYQIVPDMVFARPAPGLNGVDVEATAVLRVDIKL